MSGYRTGDADAAAERLKERFRAVSRRIEWRDKLNEIVWWALVIAIAMSGAFVGMMLLWLTRH
jgi:hypothetical protein